MQQLEQILYEPQMRTTARQSLGLVMYTLTLDPINSPSSYNVPSAPGAAYGMPSAWESPSNFGIGGPGIARTVFPGLVERQREDYSGHNGLPPHTNVDHYSILKPDWTKPLNLDRHILPLLKYGK